MKSITSRIEALEKKTKERNGSGAYCTEHLVPLIKIHGLKNRPEKAPGSICPICHKPYDPKRPIINIYPVDAKGNRCTTAPSEER